MKFLVIVSTIDLRYRYGCTPAWWQLFKNLYELGVELIVTSYQGRPVESLWWEIYENPCAGEALILTKIKNLSNKISPKKRMTKKEQRQYTLSERVIPIIARNTTTRKWRKYIFKILEEEQEVDCVIFFNVPINQIKGLASSIRAYYDLPIVFFDGDMPAILSRFGGFQTGFDAYVGADLTEYDAFIVNSKGVIPELKRMGARNVHTIYYGADPNVYSPIDVGKDIDIFFYGYGAEFRESWMKWMITEPSKILREAHFAIGGTHFSIDLGMTKKFGDIPFSAWRRFCCRSKINLNITRQAHASVYASSTSRPFELASLGCCIVSNPYNGLEEWFDINKEIFIVNNAKEAYDIYQWLLSDDETRIKAANSARKRVLKEHTYKHRAEQLLDIIKKLRTKDA